MKNFEFLKDFDSDMYTLLSEFEREAVKNPKITESYVTPFLEKVVNDILQRNNNAIDDPYVGFSKRVDKLYELKIEKHLKKRGSGEFIIPKTGIKIRRIKKKATKERQMLSPLTGKEVTIAAKPARLSVKLTALKVLKEVVNN